MKKLPSNSPPQQYRTITIFLIVLILCNPVITFLAFGSVIIALSVFLFAVLVSFYLLSNIKLKIFGIMFMYCLCTWFLFSNAELIFKYSFTEYIIEDLYRIQKHYYFNKPFLRQNFSDKEYQINYITNSQGYRIGTQDDPEKKIENVDWLFLGDSYTQGAQVEFEELFTTQLQKKHPTKIILNAGISGFSIADEYNYYINEGFLTKPKRVVLQICNFNDFMNIQERNSSFIDYLMQHSTLARYSLYNFRYTNPTELPLGRWTEPFYPTDEENKKFNIFDKRKSEQKKKDLFLFSFYLKKFSEAVKKNGSELIVMQIPTKEQVYFKYYNEVMNTFKIPNQYIDMDLPDKLLLEICKKEKVTLINLKQDFQFSTSPMFFDFDEHLTVDGHQTIADRLHKEFINEATPRIKKISILNVGDRYPRELKDGYISFQSYRDGNMELFISDTTFGNVKRLTFNSIDEIHPVVSSKYIAFTEGDQSKFNTKIGLMHRNGMNRTYVTILPNQFGAIPMFNDNGLQIVYAEWFNTSKNQFSNPVITIYNIDDNSKRTITEDFYESWRPQFLPGDNNRLIYISKRSGRFDIFIYNLKEGKESKLISTAYDKWDPSFSTDGRYLAFSGKLDGNWDLFLYDMLTGKIKRLTQSLVNEWDPSFSIDGKSIFYAADAGITNGIYKMRLEKLKD